MQDDFYDHRREAAYDRYAGRTGAPIEWTGGSNFPTISPWGWIKLAGIAAVLAAVAVAMVVAWA